MFAVLSTWLSNGKEVDFCFTHLIATSLSLIAAASTVPGCQADADLFLSDMRAAGVTLATTAELFGTAVHYSEQGSEDIPVMAFCCGQV